MTIGRAHSGAVNDETAAPRRTRWILLVAGFATFFQSGGATILDPDGPGPVWEVPVTNPATLETRNFPNPPPAPSPACG